MENKFNIGDTVIFINIGFVYSTWKEMAVKLDATKWISEKRPNHRSIGNIVNIIIHPYINDILYLVESDNIEYIIEECGLKKMEIDLSYNIGDTVKIIDSGCVYDNYVSMADLLKATNWKYNQVPKNNSIGKIIGKIIYDKNNWYLINIKGRDFVFGEKGFIHFQKQFLQDEWNDLLEKI